MFGFALQPVLPLGEIHWFGGWISAYEATVVGSCPYVYLVKHQKLAVSLEAPFRSFLNVFSRCR